MYKRLCFKFNFGTFLMKKKSFRNIKNGKASRQLGPNLFCVKLRIWNENRLHFRMELNKDSPIEDFDDRRRIDCAEFEFRNAFLCQDFIDYLASFGHCVSVENKTEKVIKYKNLTLQYIFNTNAVGGTNTITLGSHNQARTDNETSLSDSFSCRTFFLYKD